MLSTKNITETNNVSKTLLPGNQTIKVSSITLGKGYEEGSYNVFVNVEGPDQGEDFEGFLVNFNDKTGPRYKGQTGRVRLSQYSFNDGVTKTGRKVNRDSNILNAIVALAVALGKKDELDEIESENIENFVEQASTILSGDTFINSVIAGKTYLKNGYNQYDLYFPRAMDGKVPFESVDTTPGTSKLITYDPALHITHKVSTTTQTVDSFEPAKTTDDFSI